MGILMVSDNGSPAVFRVVDHEEARRLHRNREVRTFRAVSDDGTAVEGVGRLAEPRPGSVLLFT